MNKEQISFFINNDVVAWSHYEKKDSQNPYIFFHAAQNRMGKWHVPCMVSDRWIQFPKKSAGHFGGGEFIEISIMTHSYAKDQPAKLCDMIVTREDLLKAINAVFDPDKVIKG